MIMYLTWSKYFVHASVKTEDSKIEIEKLKHRYFI